MPAEKPLPLQGPLHRKFVAYQDDPMRTQDILAGERELSNSWGKKYRERAASMEEFLKNNPKRATFLESKNPLLNNKTPLEITGDLIKNSHPEDFVGRAPNPSHAIRRGR